MWCQYWILGFIVWGVLNAKDHHSDYRVMHHMGKMKIKANPEGADFDFSGGDLQVALHPAHSDIVPIYNYFRSDYHTVHQHPVEVHHEREYIDHSGDDHFGHHRYGHMRHEDHMEHHRGEDEHGHHHENHFDHHMHHDDHHSGDHYEHEPMHHHHWDEHEEMDMDNRHHEMPHVFPVGLWHPHSVWRSDHSNHHDRHWLADDHEIEGEGDLDDFHRDDAWGHHELGHMDDQDYDEDGYMRSKVLPITKDSSQSVTPNITLPNEPENEHSDVSYKRDARFKAITPDIARPVEELLPEQTASDVANGLLSPTKTPELLFPERTQEETAFIRDSTENRSPDSVPELTTDEIGNSQESTNYASLDLTPQQPRTENGQVRQLITESEAPELLPDVESNILRRKSLTPDQTLTLQSPGVSAKLENAGTSASGQTPDVISALASSVKSLMSDANKTSISAEVQELAALSSVLAKLNAPLRLQKGPAEIPASPVPQFSNLTSAKSNEEHTNDEIGKNEKPVNREFMASPTFEGSILNEFRKHWKDEDKLGEEEDDEDEVDATSPRHHHHHHVEKDDSSGDGSFLNFNHHHRHRQEDEEGSRPEPDARPPSEEFIRNHNTPKKIYPSDDAPALASSKGRNYEDESSPHRKINSMSRRKGGDDPYATISETDEENRSDAAEHEEDHQEQERIKALEKKRRKAKGITKSKSKSDEADQHDSEDDEDEDDDDDDDDGDDETDTRTKLRPSEKKVATEEVPKDGELHWNKDTSKNIPHHVSHHYHGGENLHHGDETSIHTHHRRHHHHHPHRHHHHHRHKLVEHSHHHPSHESDSDDIIHSAKTDDDDNDDDDDDDDDDDEDSDTKRRSRGRAANDEDKGPHSRFHDEDEMDDEELRQHDFHDVISKQTRKRLRALEEPHDGKERFSDDDEEVSIHDRSKEGDVDQMEVQKLMRENVIENSRSSDADETRLSRLAKDYDDRFPGDRHFDQDPTKEEAIAELDRIYKQNKVFESEDRQSSDHQYYHDRDKPRARLPDQGDGVEDRSLVDADDAGPNDRVGDAEDDAKAATKLMRDFENRFNDETSFRTVEEAAELANKVAPERQGDQVHDNHLVDGQEQLTKRKLRKRKKRSGVYAIIPNDFFQSNRTAKTYVPKKAASGKTNQILINDDQSPVRTIMEDSVNSHFNQPSNLPRSKRTSGQNGPVDLLRMLAIRAKKSSGEKH